MANVWTERENQHIIADYFEMLGKELEGIPYRKSEHWRGLIPKLNGRTKGSIERKHMNITAVLISLGQPFITGYKPLVNVQGLLEEMVAKYVSDHTGLDDLFERFTEKPLLPFEVNAFNFFSLRMEAPESLPKPKKPGASPKTGTSRILRKPNYLQIEQEKRSLGRFGEEIVLDYEKLWLRSKGKEKLAEKVEWISRDKGDGAGYDILSKYENGKDKLIEVKTTKLSEFTPFYFSKNELEASIQHRDSYHLYRVYKAATRPVFFVKQGSFEDICSRQDPIQFRGYP